MSNYLCCRIMWHTFLVQSDTEVFKLVSTGLSSRRASPKTCHSGSFKFLKRFGGRIGPSGLRCYAPSRLFSPTEAP